MSIRNAGKTIKEARLKAGMTQEQLSEGICTVLSLSRIENGSSGVSPVTFQALMAHAGAPCEVYPIFASRTDFDCFYSLKRARYFITCSGKYYDKISYFNRDFIQTNLLYMERQSLPTPEYYQTSLFQDLLPTKGDKIKCLTGNL